MTFSVTQFRNLAKQDGYVILSANERKLAVLSEGEWVEHDVQWQKQASSQAKERFLESLSREYGPQITTDLLRHYLPEDGTPLSSRDVVQIIDIGEMYRPTALPKSPTSARCAPDNIPQVDIDAYERSVAAFQQSVAELEKQSPHFAHYRLETIGKGPAASPGSEVEWPAAERIDFSTVAPPPAPAYTRVEQGGGSWLKDIASGKTPDLKPIHQQNTPPQLPVPPQVVAPPVQPAATPAPMQQGRGLRSGLNRGPRPDPRAAKIIQDAAWKDLNQVFKATIDHVAKAQDAAAKPPLSGSKKKAGKTEDSKAAEPENKFELIGGERAFAELFAKPPKLDGLATALAKCKVETKNPLSVYFDLPKIMGDTPKIVDGHVQAAPGRHWLFRMRNAETKLDAEQVIREIDTFIAQLGKDIELIETLPLSKNERDRFSEVIARLHSIHQNIREEFSPLHDLRKRCVEVQKVRPEDLPPIGQGHRYLASVALTEQMGIFDLPTGTSDLVNLANKMLAAHNMVRRQLSEGNPWEDIYNDADPQMKPILEEYRRLRLAGIAKQVKSETGVTMKLVDGKDGEKIYYFMSENRTDERQADYLLSKIAFSMGGSYRKLLDVFGYVKWDLEDVLNEQEKRAKEQAATA
jgi:hypothetical protein